MVLDKALAGWENVSVRAAVLWTLAITSICYFPTLGNGFCLDDEWIRTAPYPKKIGEIPYLFSEPVAQGMVLHYRPLHYSSLTMDYRLWGDNPAGYHLTNILLAGATAVAVFFLAMRFLPVHCALLAATFFAVLPGHSEAVIGAFNRSQVMSTLGIVVALLCFAGYLDCGGPASRQNLWGRRGWLCASVLATLCGCLAKESALVTPLLALFLACCDRPVQIRKTGYAVSLMGLACLSYLLLRRHIAGSVGFSDAESFIAGTTPLAHYYNLCRLLSLYLGLTIFPATLSCDYPLRAVTWHWSGIVWPPALALFFYFLAKGGPARRSFGFCWLWFIVALTPVLHILPLHIAFAERVLYTASPGPAIAIAIAFARLSGRKKLLAWPLICCLTALTMLRCLDWRDNATLWSKTIQTTPQSYRAHIGVGNQYALEASALRKRNAVPQAIGYYRQSILYYSKALQLGPNRANRLLAYYNLYVVYSSIGDDAAHFYRDRLLELAPRHAEMCMSLGDQAVRDRDWHEAMHWYGNIPTPVNRWDKRHAEAREKIRQCLPAMDGR